MLKNILCLFQITIFFLNLAFLVAALFEFTNSYVIIVG